MEHESRHRIYSVLIAIAFVFTIFSTMFPIQNIEAAENWWNSDYNYRQVMTINSSQIPYDLNNFPVLISIDGDVDLSLNAQPDGDDIHFIDYLDNTTIYNHEIEHYSAGTLQAWVNITSLSSTADTLLWLYYGNSGVSSRENVTDTWDSNYSGVWHFNDDDLTDSTSKGYDATTSGTTDSNNGAVAGCREFSKTNGENISVESWGGTGGNFTVECWINNGDSLAEQNFPRYLVQGPTWNDNDWCAYGRPNSGVDAQFRCTYNSSIGSNAQGGTHPEAGDFWWYLTYGVEESFDVGNGLQTIRANKTYQHSTWLNDLYGDVYNDDEFPYLTFGNDRSPSASSSFDGFMDEIRISTDNRSIPWLDTTYNTIALSSDFQYISVGEEELAPSSDPIVSSPSPEDGATNQDLQPICSALITDPDVDDTTVYFYENTTGDWALQQVNLTHTSGTVAQWNNYANATSGDTKYWWSVNATDGSTWDNETFSFTTTDIPPILSNPDPANNSIDNPLDLVWSVQMNDTQGDTLSWSIESSNGQTAEGSGQPPYNTPSLADTDVFTEKWEVLRVEDTGIYWSCEPVTADVTGDGIEEIFIGGRRYNETTYPREYHQYAWMFAYDGATGAELWKVNFTVDYVGVDGGGISGNSHWCPIIYDFNKTNPGLEITWASGMKYHRMYDALTGDVLWNTSDFACGWHSIGYLDDGEEVYLYTIEGINSIYGYAQDGDEGLTKSFANNGTMITRARHGYECFGGPAIADINDDGKYEILVTDRSRSPEDPDNVYKGLSCYDEDLNFLWAWESSTVSTQCPMIADVDNDGDLEVILGSQGGSYGGRVMVFSGDPSGSVGEIEFTSPYFGGNFHHQNAIGNTDDDSNLEFFGNGYDGKPIYIYDFIENEMIDLGTSGGRPGEIANIIPDDGVQINEIIAMRVDGGGIEVLQYNTSTELYDVMFDDFGGPGVFSSVSDVDFDGYKEIIITFWNRIEVWETNVTVQDPKPITSVAYGGMRRLNNDEFIEPPGHYEFAIYGENNGTKNLSLTDLDYDTTYTMWVNATDSGSGLWNRSIFYFTTEADVNNQVVIKNPNPANNSIDQEINVDWQVTMEDPESDVFSWVMECEEFTSFGVGESNGTKTISLTDLSYDTTYTIYMNATDLGGSGHPTFAWFNFTTIEENYPPVISNPNPANNSYIHNYSVNWSINITDANENDNINWTVECSNGQDIAWNDEQYIGSDGINVTGLQSFEGDVVGIPWTMDADVNGYAINISVNIGCNGQSYTVKCALYDENRYYIVETEERTIYPVEGMSWKSFNFIEDDIELSADTDYYIVVMMNQSDTPEDSCSIYWENESGDNASVWILIDYGYGEFPEFDYNSSAEMWGDENRTLHMRCYYDSNIGGTKNISLTDLDYDTTYTVWVNATDGTNTVERFYYFTYEMILTITTQDATGITNNSAYLNSYVEYDGGQPCDIHFEWGTTESYGDEVKEYDLSLQTDHGGDGQYYDIWGDGTYIYNAMYFGGLDAHSYDGSEFTLLDSDRYADTYIDVWGDGTYIYVAIKDSPFFIDHAIFAYSFDGTTLSFLDVRYTGTVCNAVWGDGTYLYAATNGGMQVYTFDGVTFTLLDSDNSYGSAAHVWGDGTYIYVAHLNDGLVAYSFDGVTLTIEGEIDEGYTVRDVWTDDTYVYAISFDDGIYAYSFDGSTFTLLDSRDDESSYNRMYGYGDYIYTTNYGNGMTVYSFDGTTLSFLDQVDFGGGTLYRGVYADEYYVYVAADYKNLVYVNKTARVTDETSTVNLTDLQAGQIYHYRAIANNTLNESYGEDVAFLTRPNETRNPAATEGIYTINITWIKGDGANNTYIERNTASSWDRGDGTLVYNDTGTFYNDSGLSPDILYYYQLWSFTNWTYNPTIFQFSSSYNSTSGTAQILEPPTNGISSYDTVANELTLEWDSAAFSDVEIVVQNNVSHPTSPTDGWARYNGSAETFTGVQTSTAYFSVWSYNESLNVYSFIGLDIPWGVLNINVYDENQPWIEVSDYDLLITNEGGTETYDDTGLSNPTTIFYEDIPFGENTIVQISHDDYNTRNTYVDMYLNTFNNFTFYLTPVEIVVPPGDPDDPEGGDDCIIRSFIDSIYIDDIDVNQIINLTHILEDFIQVEVYNDELFGSYGGWIVVANDFVIYNSTNVTILHDILTANMSMARVSYYYESCDTTFIPSGLYYIRIVESYVTSYGITDLSVEDAKVTFQKYMNTTDRYENISTLFTDTNGFVNLYLIPGSLYRVIIENSGYETKTVSYQPAPPNEFGQTTEQVFRIERIDVETEPSISIPNEEVVVVPYNTTVFEIYYINLNNNNNYVNFTIYDGDTPIFYYNETTDPDEIFLYFNFSSYDLEYDILTLVVNATKNDGSFDIHVRYFSISQAARMGPPTLAPIAAILSISLCMFGLTLVHPKKVFGAVGVIVLIIAIAITTTVPQVWYLHLIQAIELILLIIVFLIFKEEGVHAV